MKTNITKKGLYTGATVGLILFILVGLLPSSFVGGVLGLKIAAYIMGTNVDTALLFRAIVGISMVLGILVTGVVFVIGASLLGWGIGHVGLIVKQREAHKLA
jgi:hypothetical protein